MSEAHVAATRAHPALRVSSPVELEQLVTVLEQDDVEVVRPERDEIPGAIRCYAYDPWGNRLELVA